jgi:thymidylate kinase
MARVSERRAPLIAVIGCDGSGKSTVSEAVLAWARRFGPAEAVHLGKQSGNVGRALGQLPLVGKSIDKAIVHQSKDTQGQRGDKNPKLFPALVVFGFQLRRLRRFRRMMALWKKNVIIVSDRFPQVDVPGAYDGTLLSTTAPAGAAVHWMAKRERAQFEWMTSYRPDLVIRLNVDIDTACARKPDHRRQALEKKVLATPLFTFKGAPIVEIDSRQPLAQVIAEAQAAVTRTLTERGYTRLDA